MRKKFLHDDYGAENLFWDKNWSSQWSSRVKGPITIDSRLARCFAKYLIPGMKVLEGGCGDCKYVRYLKSIKMDVVGVDYAESTVNAAKDFFPDLDIRIGDIAALNFPDNCFDAYYSGGVIEHFELGVVKQLQEAHRVLKNNASFLVAVPHMNWSRRIEGLFFGDRYVDDLDGRKAFVRENIREFSHEEPPKQFHFHEYCFTVEEMRSWLKSAGFAILEEIPYSAVYGLLDLGFFRKITGRDSANRNIVNKAFSAPVPVFRAIDKIRPFAIGDIVEHAFGNLMLYSCKALK